MSPPSCATAGRTRVSISSLIWSMMSASAGSSSKSASSATWMPAARAGREQRRAADEMVEQGLEHQRLEVGPRHARRRGHRDEVAAVEHAFDHAAVEQRRGERRGLGALGVGEVARARLHHGLAGQELAGRRDWASARCGSAWPRCGPATRLRSRTEGRRAGDDPAGDARRRRPGRCSATHHLPGRIGSAPAIELGLAGDHRLGQLAARASGRRGSRRRAGRSGPRTTLNHSSWMSRACRTCRCLRVEPAGPCKCRPRPARSRPSPTWTATAPSRARTLSAPSGVWPMPVHRAAQVIARRRAGRGRNWRSARSSFRRSPTAGGRSAAVRIAMPDQMCQSVWWFSTDHQLNSDQRRRAASGRAGSAGPRPAAAAPAALSGASPTDTCRGRPCRSCRGRRSCALIAFTSLPAAAALNAWRRPSGRRASLAAKSCGFCQISGLAPVLPTSGRCPAGTSPDALSRQVRDLALPTRGPRRGRATDASSSR